MRSPGIVDIVFRYASPPATGVAVDRLTAQIFNSLGELKETIVYSPSSVIQEITDSDTYYLIADFDASSLDYPGSWLNVTWQVTQGASSPVFYTSHWYVPVVPFIANSRVVSWEQSSRTDLVGYYVESKATESAEYTYLGATTFPYFIDKTLYQVPTAYEDVSYAVTELVWGPSPGSPGPILGDQISSVSSQVLDKPACIIYGSINQINNTAEEVDYIRFYLDYRTAPFNIDSTFYLSDRELVVSLVDGKFCTWLPQGLVVTAEIPSIGYVKRFIVPDRDVISLHEIEGTVIETCRAP